LPYLSEYSASECQGHPTPFEVLSALKKELEVTGSIERAAENVGLSRSNAYRYLAIEDLIPELRNLVNDRKIPLRIAETISRLSSEDQKILYEDFIMLSRVLSTRNGTSKDLTQIVIKDREIKTLKKELDKISKDLENLMEKERVIENLKGSEDITDPQIRFFTEEYERNVKSEMESLTEKASLLQEEIKKKEREKTELKQKARVFIIRWALRNLNTI